MRNYITIGNLCIGFGKPPADLLAQRRDDKSSFVPSCRATDDWHADCQLDEQGYCIPETCVED